MNPTQPESTRVFFSTPMKPANNVTHVTRHPAPRLSTYAPDAYSTIFGTMKRPLARAGAFFKASSFEREGAVSSGRVTLTRGKAWAVGSTPETSTSLSFSM